MAAKYDCMSSMEFGGYFEGKFELVKCTRVEIHTSETKEQQIIATADGIRKTLKQKNLAFEFNN